MARDRASAISEIAAHFSKSGGGYSGWYVGITADPRQRLFSDHGVRERSDAWIFRQCISSGTARAVEDHFLSLGMKGGAGGGDRGSDYVYAYKIGGHTTE